MTKLIFVALVAALLGGMPGVAGARPNPADIESQVVCPTCKTTLDQSSSPVAQRMKAFIRERIAAGDSTGEIKQQLVDQFGTGVLAEPPRRGFDLLAWLVPLGALAGGAIVVAALVWSWSGKRDAVGIAAPEPLDAELERRVDEELARFES